MTERAISAAMALLLALGVSTSVDAARTESFTDDTYQTFASGDLTTSTLTGEGQLLPPFRRRNVVLLDAEVVWDLAEVEGRRYAATGHEGKLYQLRPNQPPVLVHDFEEPALYSIEPGPVGSLLVGASPGGRIYRVESTGERSLFATAGERVIWDMLQTEVELYVATGPNGRIIRVFDDGTTAPFASLGGVTNVLDLEPVPGTNDIVAATQGRGLVARISPDGRVGVLFDPGEDEVRALGYLPDRSLIAAVNGERAPGEKLLRPTEKPSEDDKPVPSSFLIRIDEDGYAEEWWTSPESPIHDIRPLSDYRILVSAGSSGSLYIVDRQGRTGLTGLTSEEIVTRLLPLRDDRILVGTANAASVLSADLANHQAGMYRSRVFDARMVARWGRISGLVNRGDGSILVSYRGGNSAEPDDTWSPWSPSTDFADANLEVENVTSRFFQYRLELVPFDGLRPIPPTVDSMRVFYSRPNVKPSLRDLAVAREESEVKPENAAPGLPGMRPHAPFVNLTWAADDPNNDELRYDVFLQDLREANWMMIAEDLTEKKHRLPTALLPDGEYRFRVVAGDEVSNVAGEDKASEAVSELFLIDNSQPALLVLTVQRDSPQSVTVRVRGEDRGSVIAAAAWRAGVGDWNMLHPDDGALDQQSENFSITVEGLDAEIGNHITVVVSDEAGNTVVEKVRLD